MLTKKIEFSTQWKVSQIIEKLESITLKCKSLDGHKKIEPNFAGEYDNSGFIFFRSGMRPLGNNIFSAKFIELESKTDIVVSIKPSSKTTISYILIIALMVISLLGYRINYDLVKATVLIVIFLIPILLAYISFKEDVKRAKLFLVEFFQVKEQLF